MNVGDSLDKDLITTLKGLKAESDQTIRDDYFIFQSRISIGFSVFFLDVKVLVTVVTRPVTAKPARRTVESEETARSSFFVL